MPDFKLVAPFEPTGDQPKAIEGLIDGLAKGLDHQVLLGVTGSGKTYTLSKVIEQHNKPTLVLAHNKTLAAQLYAEFREFFPDNKVEYFVSYFDYYQPEAYLPRSDTYIEKDSSRNDEIDRLRHAATHALFERRDVIIVASVSCIYGLGAPVDYGATVLKLRTGGQYRRDAVLRHLVDLQYQRNDAAMSRARFRVRGDTLELQPASEEILVRVEFFGDQVERITELDPLTGELLAERKEVNVYPATHYVTPQDKLKEAIVDIEAEMEERVTGLEAEGRALEGARLRQRTTFDLEMMRELGYCTGIENYSRHLSRREAGSRPWTLLDYFPPDWLLVVDESHMTIPQVVGMYKNDRTRKEILVDFGFRLPSALDNRPLTFEEFEATVHQAIYMSATPGPYELERSKRIVQQLIRPTGIVDPQISVRPTEGQIDDLLEEIRGRVERGERALVTTLTKKMAEDLTDYLQGARRQGPVPPQRGRHARAGRHPARPAARRVRRPRRDQPPARGDRPARGDPGRHPRRRQGGLPALGLVAHPDDRPGGPEHRRRGDHVRRPDHRVDARGDRRDRPPADVPGGLQPRARHRADDDRQGHPRPQRAAACRRRVHRRLRLGAGRRVQRGRPEARSRRVVARMEAEMKAAAKQLEFERAAALRDEIQQIRLRVLEEDASITVGRAAERAASDAGGRGLTGAADRARGRRGAAAAVAAGPGMEVTSVTVLPADEEPSGTLDGVPGEPGIDEGTIADWLPGHPGRARGRGRLAGALARPPDLGPDGHAEHPRRTGQRPGRRR